MLFRSILGAKFPTILLCGGPGCDFCVLFACVFKADFFMILGSILGDPPPPLNRLSGRGSARLCFLTFHLKTELTLCVYQHFWFSGFLEPLRERERNLSFSISVSGRSVPEGQTGHRETTRLACQRHGGGYMQEHISLGEVALSPCWELGLLIARPQVIDLVIH